MKDGAPPRDDLAPTADSAASTAGKLVTLAEAEQRCAALRASGKTTVLVNGAFDMLHVGHARYLADARSHADLLIAAVNSDASVQLSKGPLRPVVPETERVELLSYLWMVDLIVLFDTATVGPVLERLRPTFHAKGTDYSVDSVPEREIVAAYGGRTIICGDPKDHATTDVIGTILQRFGPS